MTELVPLILCALDDAVRAKSLAAPEDADLAALADGLTLAVDHGALVYECRRDPNRKAPAIVGTLVEVLTDGDKLTIDQRMRSSGWPNIVTVARRLADVAASLCVRGMALRREAEALWKAATRLLGMEGVPASVFAVVPEGPTTYGRRLADEMAINSQLRADLAHAEQWRREAEHSVKESARRGVEIDVLRDQIATLKRKHAEDDRALVEAHARELREAKEAHAKEVADLREKLDEAISAGWIPSFMAVQTIRADVPPTEEEIDRAHAIAKRLQAAKPISPIPSLSYRDAILEACAYECTIYLGPAQGEMRVVVGLRDGKTLDDVAAVLERMGRAPGTYSLREVRSPETRPAVVSAAPWSVSVSKDGAVINGAAALLAKPDSIAKIGKLKGSTICLEHDDVGRMHAVLERHGDRVMVIDLGTATGTFIEHRSAPGHRVRIGKNATLGPGDTIWIGDYRIAVNIPTT